jgi:WD40 repeat protein
VRCTDYSTRKEVTVRHFSIKVTCLKWVPLSVDSTGRSIIVGFVDGTVRVLGLGEDPTDPEKQIYVMGQVFKPHNAAVTDMAFNDKGSLLATSGKDGIIFLFRLKEDEDEAAVLTDWAPLNFIKVAPTIDGSSKVAACESLSWRPGSAALGPSSLLCACSDGALRELDLSAVDLGMPTAQLTEDGGEVIRQFEATCAIVERVQKVHPGGGTAAAKAGAEGSPKAAEGKEKEMESPTKNGGKKGDDESTVAEEVVLLPLKFNKAVYSLRSATTDPTALVAATTSGLRSFLHEFTAECGELPRQELLHGVYSRELKYTDKDPLLRNPVSTSLKYSWSSKFLSVGLSDGTVVLRPVAQLETFSRVSASNSQAGGVALSAVSFDDKYVLSAGFDGTMSVFRVRLDLINRTAPGRRADLDADVYAGVVTMPDPKDLSTRPSFSYLELKVEGVATADDELFAETQADRTLPSPEPENLLIKDLLSAENETSDIVEGSYSIQDHAAKMEQNAKEAAAAQLKIRVLQSIKVLQQDYQKIMDENRAIPEVARLTDADINVDEEWFAQLTKEGEAMVEEVKKECEYDSERAVRLLQKIKERMMDRLVVEEMPLLAFRNPKKGRQAKSLVYSLRTCELNDRVKDSLKDVATALRNEEIKAGQDVERNKIASIGIGSPKRIDATAGIEALVESSILSSKTRAASKDDVTMGKGAVDHGQDSRTGGRLKRKAELAGHEKDKPREDEDDVRDLAAIKQARSTIGDYKLKVADDYEVPEAQRINVTKKVHQMALMENSMTQVVSCLITCQCNL